MLHAHGRQGEQGRIREPWIVTSLTSVARVGLPPALRRGQATARHPGGGGLNGDVQRDARRSLRERPTVLRKGNGPGLAALHGVQSLTSAISNSSPGVVLAASTVGKRLQ